MIDFGVARSTDETSLTDTGVTVGSWAYVAPERFRTKDTTDARADVYALACVLHEALTGKPPFGGDSLAQLVTAHMFEPPPKPSNLHSAVPMGMDQVIAIGMAKESDRRYATTKDLARAARAALTTEPLDQGVHRDGVARDVAAHSSDVHAFLTNRCLPGHRDFGGRDHLAEVGVDRHVALGRGEVGLTLSPFHG